MKSQVHHRREVRVEAERAAGFANHFSVLAEEPAVSGGEYIRRGRCRTSDVAEPVHPAAFHVHTSKQGRGDARMAIFEQRVRLLRAGNVAGKEDHSCGLYPCELGTETGRHFGAVEADDEKLADFLAKIGSDCIPFHYD